MIDRLAALIEEHEHEGIGTLLYGLIDDALRGQLMRYPLALLLRRSVDQVNEQIRAELTVEFAEHLLDGRLSEALAIATTERHLYFLLRLRARQFLQNRTRGGERENIATRTLGILKADPRFVSEQRAEVRWKLRATAGAPVVLPDSELRRLARALPIPPSMRRFSRDTKIASAVLTDDDLRQLLIHTLEEAEGSLTIAQLRTILDERLALQPTETISIYRRTGNEPSLEEILESPRADYDQADLGLLATDIVEELSERQLRILRLRLGDGLSRVQCAAALGVSHGTVDNELARIRDIVLAGTEHDVEDAKIVLRMIAGGGEEDDDTP